ncbi:MAG: hypothetical protein GXX96_06015 [Planctomycetaceae bacterium]|nr:hypothetical protein [Planctomycetaceae bacterium]
MNRILIAAALVGLISNCATVCAQTWMFQPGTYSNKPHGSQAPAGTPKAQAFATFTESQAAAAAKLPKPAFQWDPTGIHGRTQRYQMWTHLEEMEANRLRNYAQGVRDAVGAPIWTWNGAAPQATPQIFAPTATSPGKTQAPGRP